MSIEVKKITESSVLGEGPHWDDGQQCLFYVSIDEKQLHKYVPATGEHTKTTLCGRVGFIVPVEGTSDQFVVGLEREIVIVQWDGAEGSKVTVLKKLGEVDCDKPNNRLNDGKVDPWGRLFAGTMGREVAPGEFEHEAGNLYRISNSEIKKVVSCVSVSNGLAWDLKHKAFYYIDSMERKIRRYDYDVRTGEISNMEYIFDFGKHDVAGFPDGMTIDTDGNLWVAMFGGSCVVKINPHTGEILLRIPIQALQVTSVTFGGPGLDILFVTTACTRGKQHSSCGATFMVYGLGVKGHPNNNFKL